MIADYVTAKFLNVPPASGKSLLTDYLNNVQSIHHSYSRFRFTRSLLRRLRSIDNIDLLVSYFRFI